MMLAFRVASLRWIGAALFLALFGLTSRAQEWTVQTSGIDTNLRGISAAKMPDGKEIAVWACGSKGVVLRSVDSGKTWKQLRVEGGETLDFRGIVSFGKKIAYLMSSGEGEKSRIYKTTDGGNTWRLQYTDKRQAFFLDGLACLSETHCFALSDPVDGKFLLLHTEDGEHWSPVPSANMPPALPNEGVFAASNSSFLLYGKNELYFGTGGLTARVFHSEDLGKSWTVVNTPMGGDAASGIFSIARRGDLIVAVGGDYKNPLKANRTAAYSKDRGRTWKLSSDSLGGYRSAVVFTGDQLLAVGPGGEDTSRDSGVRWSHAHQFELNALFLLDSQNGWAVGSKGAILRFILLLERFDF